MNRLWVRLSLMLSGVLFFVFFMQFLSIMLIPDPAPGGGGPPAAGEFGHEDPDEIARRLVEFAAFSVVVGIAGGIVIGRVISAPVSALAKAAHRLGQGEMEARVPVRGSQELVELAEGFNKMAANLQHAETLRNNLMADVSHELRTPLTVLEGNLRAVLDHVYTLDEAEIANLYRQTRHLIRLVNDLRELSLAESGQLPLERQPIHLNLLVAETLQALEPLAAEKQVELIDQTAPLPEISADPVRIRQVLFNLISNSLRHTPQGGKITMSSSGSDKGVTLSVQDTGEGFEVEQLASVFDRFYRADKSRSRETGGTGLGLSIVRAIVEAHGGQVEARSAGKGQGSQFVLFLPLHP
jgi:signal transduction histidine kinase